MAEEQGGTLRDAAGERLEPVGGEQEGPGGMRKPGGPTLRRVVDGVAAELESAGVESPRVEARRLVCHAAGIGRDELALEAGDEPLRPGLARRLAGMVRRRLSGEPLQYIEGTVEFRDLVLRCDRRALIPRPETEQLVERAAAWIEDRGEPAERALDVGTGSGAIALSLLDEGLSGEAVGLDSSREALMLAAENRRVVGVPEDRFELRWVQGDLWNSVSSRERFDLVISNPPYVRDGEMAGLPTEVAEHEPEEALRGGEDGLDVIREIAGPAAAYLRPGGALFLEIGPEQGEAVRAILESGGGWSEVVVRQDLAGRDRFVRAVSD